jgi:hypothetical protein
LAPFTEAVDFLRDGVGMKDGSWSDEEALLDSESTGEGSVELELDQMGVSWCCLLIKDTVGIVSPGRAGVLRVDVDESEGVGSSFESALRGDESLSSDDDESSRDAGETGVRGRGVNRSSGLMHVGSCCCCCCCWCCEYKLVG